MPISEDEYSPYSNDSTPSTTMSKAEIRKTHKPIMEKRRRAKINNCLNEIKDLILVAMKKDPERHSKLEKADILEMAVKHLKSIQKQQKEFAIRTDPSIAMKYKNGYLECASEVSDFINKMESVEPAMKQRLSSHLNKCATSLDYKPTFPFDNPFTSSSSLLASLAQNKYQKIDDQNNNNGKIQGIELIPSCLPSGEFAFLVPKSSFTSMMSSHMGEERPSAFVTVTPSSKQTFKISKPLSPPLSPTNEDFQPRDLHQRDLHTRELHTRDFHPHDLHQRDSHPLDLHPRDSHPRDTQQRGFQPVIPKSDMKVSATSTQNEIQSIKFPINTTKKESVAEPLSIITNSAERFRHAQMLHESCNYEENVYQGQKRRLREDGLLVLAEPPSKLIKLEMPSSSKSDNEKSGEGSKSNESMWRPW